MKLLKKIGSVFSAAFLVLALTHCGKHGDDNNGAVATNPIATACQTGYTYYPSNGQCLPNNQYGYNGGYGGYSGGTSQFCPAGYGLYHGQCVPASYCQSSCPAGQTATYGNQCLNVDACGDPCYAHVGNMCLQQ